MQGGGEFAITEQANVVQQVTGPMSKLVEKSMDLRQQHRPVISPLMQTQNILAQPTPELFNRIEPVGVGGRLTVSRRGSEARTLRTSGWV